MAKSILTEERDWPEGMWIWCLHCERCYQVGEFRAVKPDRYMVKMGFTGDIEMCPYSDCNGDTLMDSWDWQAIREMHPEYPEVPERGKVYPMYSKKN
jgi:hypothetical protein